MSWAEKLHISHRMMAIALTTACMIPIVLSLFNIPFTLPMTIGPITKDFYNQVQNLPPGSIVAFGNQQSYGGYIVKKDCYKALLYQLFDRKAKLVLCSFWTDTPQCWTDIIAYSGMDKKYNLVYGVDYVVFGFLSGDESALAASAADFHKAYATDLYGHTTDSLPLMSQVHSLKDVQLTICDASSFTFVDMFVRQWPAAYNVPSINIYVYSTVAPYYGRYVQGCLDGVRGYAEYESLTGYNGSQLLMLTVRNLQAIWLFFAIILGNVTYRALKGTKKELPKQKT
jgi:hypothetical protein